MSTSFSSRTARPWTRRRRGDILDLIGSTRMLEIEGIYVKNETENPTFSIKDRSAQYILDRAEEEGLLFANKIICDATTGNFGNALALQGAARGYRVELLQPAKMSSERTMFSESFGAEIIPVGEFEATEALELSRERAEDPAYYVPLQFENELNIDASYFGIGSEFVRQLEERERDPNVLVAGAGTGATTIGIARRLREINPDLRVVVVEPDNCRTLAHGEVGEHQILGINDGFVPPIIARNRELITDVVSVSSEEAIDEAKRLATEYGLAVGPSSGANFLASKRFKEENPELETVVTVFPDSRVKYFSLMNQ